MLYISEAGDVLSLLSTTLNIDKNAPLIKTLEPNTINNIKNKHLQLEIHNE